MTNRKIRTIVLASVQTVVVWSSQLTSSESIGANHRIKNSATERHAGVPEMANLSGTEVTRIAPPSQ